VSFTNDDRDISIRSYMHKMLLMALLLWNLQGLCLETDSLSKAKSQDRNMMSRSKPSR